MVVTASEAARLLRTRTEIIFKMIESGEIPAYRDGRNWKIPRSLLEAYVEERAMKEAKTRREVRKEMKDE